MVGGVCLALDSTGAYVHYLLRDVKGRVTWRVGLVRHGVCGIVRRKARARDIRGRCRLYLIGQGLMADYSWLCMCDGKRGSWWLLICCGLLCGGGGGWRAALQNTLGRPASLVFRCIIPGSWSGWALWSRSAFWVWDRGGGFMVCHRNRLLRRLARSTGTLQELGYSWPICPVSSVNGVQDAGT